MWSERLRPIKQLVRPLVPDFVLRNRQLAVLRRRASKNGLRVVAHDLFFDLVRGDTILRTRKSHAFYLDHMIENFDYFVDSVIPIQTNGTRLVDMSGPRYHRLKGYGDVPFLFPSHTEPYHTTAEYLDFAGLKGGEIVLDIGAYSGVTSIIFAQLVGTSGHVYAFEADETNSRCAQINLEMASRVLGLRNITLVRKAVWSDNGGVLFSHEGAMGSGAVSITGDGRGQQTVVPSTRLEDCFGEFGLDHADFVKLDIEGGEVEVLRSSAGFLRRVKARLIVEPHFVDGSMSTDRCRNLLESAGYQVKVRDKVGESAPLIEAVP
jgi:FkbM family methyltransferase